MNTNVTFYTIYGEKVDYTKKSRKSSMNYSIQLKKSESEEKASTPINGTPQLGVNKNN